MYVSLPAWSLSPAARLSAGAVAFPIYVVLPISIAAETPFFEPRSSQYETTATPNEWIIRASPCTNSVTLPQKERILERIDERIDPDSFFL